MSHNISRLTVIIYALFMLLSLRDLYSKNFDFRMIDISRLNRYDEDRIAYQQYEKSYDQFRIDTEDNSIAALMIIKDKRIYLFEDGYDNPEAIRKKAFMYATGNQMSPDLWENKISGNPNFFMATDRKVELLKNNSKEWIASNYKDYYSSIRNEFLKRHVSIFLSLIISRTDTDMIMTRKELPKKISDQSPAKYSLSVVAHTKDGGAVYFAEDADGDGITETFTVNTTDGFSWGYKAGANMINIISNTQKDVERIIGKITYFAYYGSPAEELIVKKSFPTQDRISEMINDLYRIDPDTVKFLKDNKINLEESVDKAGKGENK
ncbi:MAG: hypothetical protein A2W19_10890 [Spirochaetes bacterium RBG_16_49_21]|nr:MAG: hypothetical protein A2W19_10890 [Spirochaetes bacterium RBG_16_49_21]